MDVVILVSNMKHPADVILWLYLPGVLECQQQGCEYKTRTKDGMKKHVEKVHMGIRYDFILILG